MLSAPGSSAVLRGLLTPGLPGAAKEGRQVTHGSKGYRVQLGVLFAEMNMCYFHIFLRNPVSQFISLLDIHHLFHGASANGGGCSSQCHLSNPVELRAFNSAQVFKTRASNWYQKRVASLRLFHDRPLRVLLSRLGVTCVRSSWPGGRMAQEASIRRIRAEAPENLKASRGTGLRRLTDATAP